MKATAFSVRPYHDSKRPKLKFVATGPLIQGKRWRRFFETKAEAEGFLQLKKVERENHGARALEFPEALRIMAAECAATLEPFGWTLRDAVAFCLPHLQAKHRSCPIERAKDEMLAAKKKDGASRRYVEDLRSRLGQMATGFPAKPLAEFTVADVDDWLRGLPVAALTRNHFRRVASCLFAFGMERGYCATNPAAKSAKAKTLESTVGLLTVSETARLLEAASVDLLPAIAVQAFAGLRRAEVERLDWKEIDLAAGLLEVRADKAKTARRRLIKIQPNLSAWLAAHVRLAGPVAPVNYRVRLDEARTAAKLAEWPHNALRHGFASYHLAHFNNAAELALELGHTNSALIFTHYRQVVKPKEAARYWDLKPSGTEETNIVVMNR